MKGIYLLLGSNLGDSKEVLNTAINHLNESVGRIVKTSSVYKTKAWGIEDQPDFLNQVLEIETNLKPQDLLEQILNIEKEMGRIRYQKWGMRIIDIDILYYGDKILKSNELTIPHPENQNRNFVLAPMAEIAPDFVHPELQKSQQELLEQCSDYLEVKRIK